MEEKRKRQLLVIGAGGHGKVCADIAIKMKKWERIFFLDDKEGIKECMGFPVIDKVSAALCYKENTDYFVAIGDNVVREQIQEKLECEGASVAILLHPDAVIGLSVKIGKGSTVMAGAVINSASQIGKGCIVNTGSSIDHDNVIEDYVHISPGVRLAGDVKIGKGSFIGVGSTVSNHITICGGCQTGAGTVVIKNIEKKGIYIGIPAQMLGVSR